MKVTVAIDSFKGSLSTFEAGNAVKEGILRVFGDAQVAVRPLADGGEGTASALIAAMEGELCDVTVHDPLGRPITCQYGIMREKKLAVMEMSAAAGITLIDAIQRDPFYTTTYGVGEMIADAAQKGCRKIVIGIGGSATNDGGVGMLQALGFDFLDQDGKPIPYGAKGLERLKIIRDVGVSSLIHDLEIHVACDVKNPLCGENGCSAVYGPQKGATPESIGQMDAWLSNYADLTKERYPDANPNAPGAGAAGGLGFAFLSYLGAKLEPGIDLVIQETGLESFIQNSDIVVTGEGRLDGQSCMGKAPVGVATLAKKYGKPVIAFSGAVTREAKLCNQHGIDAFFPILRAPCSLEEAMDTKQAFENLADTAEQAFRLIAAFSL